MTIDALTDVLPGYHRGHSVCAADSGMWTVGFITILIFAGVVVISVITHLVQRHRRVERERLAAIEREATMVGLRSISKPGEVIKPFKLLPGGAKGIQRAYAGDIDGHRICLIEHRYVVSTGQTTVTVYHEAAVTSVPPQWPKLALKPENVLTRLGGRFGFRGVELENERFNERWRVVTRDRAFAELLLTPDVQAILVDQPRGRIWKLDKGHFGVMEKKSLRAADVSALVTDLVRVMDAIPPELDAWTPELGASTRQV